MNQVYSKNTVTFAGYASPEAALETYFWAFYRANKQAILQSVTPEFQKLVADKTEDQIIASVQRESMMGYMIKKREAVSDEMVLLHISGVGREIEVRWILSKIGNDWKLAGIQNDCEHVAAS